MSIESRIKETEDLLTELKSEQYRRKTINAERKESALEENALEEKNRRISLEKESQVTTFLQGFVVQTPIDLEKENLIRKFTSDLYQTVNIECREMLKVFDFAEDFINKMKEEKQ
jgi:hypothetical protein